MNIVNKLTLRHIKENKGRTVVTTMGIIVSVAMITAVFVALASFLNLFADIEQVASGYNVATLTITSQEQYDKLKADDRISDVGVISYVEGSYQLEKRKSDYLGTGEMRSGDEAYLKQIFTGDYEGEIPKNANEIAVEQKLIDKNNLDWKIGDTVNIPLGNRIILVDGEEITTGGSYTNGEKFDLSEIGEFKITAILHDNPATVSSTDIVRGYKFNKDSVSESNRTDVTIALKTINHNSLDELNDIVKTYSIEEYEIKYSYLEMFFAYDDGNEMMTPLISMTAFIIAIIIIASVVLIYNAFAMSISERVRYLGMLASVGATKKQKRMSVYFESLILAAIGIPVGFAAGVAGIGITLKALGSKIISTGMIMGISDSNVEMKIVVPPYAAIGILAVSVFTIFISSFIPSRKASRVTPIDAIRQRQEIKVKARKLRSSKLVRAIFGYEGELANKNLKRNGRKARVITVSIAMSVILFLSCNYFCDMFTRSVDVEGMMPYQIAVFADYDKREKVLEVLSKTDDIDKYYCVSNFYHYFADGGEAKIEQPEYYTDTYKNFADKGCYVYLNAIDDEDFDEFCKANNLDYTQYYTDENKAVVLNNVSHKENSSKVFSNKMLGTAFDDLYYPMQAGGFAEYDSDNYICNLNPQNTISMYIPFSKYVDLKLAEAENNPDVDEADVLYQVGIETDKHKELTERLNELSAQGDLNGTVIDYEEEFQVMNTIAFIIQVLVYGFIALISLITVFNIINTISTGIALRKKEFAMLKSVGTTPKGFNKMIMLESAFYGIKAMVFALPISALLAFLMNKAMGMATVPFELNVPLYLAVTAVVFVIIGFTMLYSVNKLRDDSIVETLKEDIS
ncbi:MAG: ABC transporter permease [Eubacterium sp.]|nr:ABC transporter permease [Eubacterium sp.]